MASSLSDLVALYRCLEERYREVTREIEEISQSILERTSSLQKTATENKIIKSVEPTKSEFHERNEEAHSQQQFDFSGTESMSFRQRGAVDSSVDGNKTPRSTATEYTGRGGMPENTSLCRNIL